MSLAGTVTSASSSPPLGDICVYLYQVGNSTAATFATCTVTGDQPTSSSRVTSGSYDVAFADPSGYYLTQWYNGTLQEPPTNWVRPRSTVPSGNGTLSGHQRRHGCCFSDVAPLDRPLVHSSRSATSASTSTRSRTAQRPRSRPAR